MFDSQPNRQHDASRQRGRAEAAGRLAGFGCLGGAAFGIFGFLAIIAVLELLASPPLVSPPNYGQFSIIVMGVAFYLGILGALLFLVPWGGWYIYVPLHAVGLWCIWSIDRDFFVQADWAEVPMVAMIVVFLLPTPVAVACHWWVRHHVVDTVQESTDEPE